MKISRKQLWSIVTILVVLLLGQSYICREPIKNTINYYSNKAIDTFEKPKRNEEAKKALAEFLNAEIREKSVILFEPNPYHHECLPGYAKYFTELGYKVDLLIQATNEYSMINEESMILFEPKNQLNIFTFNNLEQLNILSEEISEKFSKYDRSVLATTDPGKRNLIEKLGFFNNTRSLFVVHDTETISVLEKENNYNPNHILVLGDFDKGIYVNPHYFGEIPEHQKNDKTRFFATSSASRNYSPLINAVGNLDKLGADFEILVVGRTDTFTEKNIPKHLKKYFVFKNYLSYKEMYEEIEQSDYIIVSLDRDVAYDNIFRTQRATGSAQLVYGFCKPPIICQEFADFYKFDSKHAFIYDENKNLHISMLDAINLSSEKYAQLSHNIHALAKSLHDISLENLKKALS